MNDDVALYLGAFTKWVLKGFNTKFLEETGKLKEFKTMDEYYSYKRKTRYIGYLTVLILVVIFGLVSE